MARKLVCGVGVNDVSYPKGTLRCCPYYSRWTGMLRRCYSKAYQEIHESYSDCSVCEEWLTFSNFRDWMKTQDWERKELDKDFLVDNNRVYSPETCMFIDSDLNMFLCSRAKLRGDYPLGVSYSRERGKFESKISYKGKTLHFGRHCCPIVAHKEWIKGKIVIAKELLEAYDDPKVKEGLNRIIKKLEYHLENNLEVKSL